MADWELPPRPLASMQSAMNPQMGRELNVTDSVFAVSKQYKLPVFTVVDNGPAVRAFQGVTKAIRYAPIRPSTLAEKGVKTIRVRACRASASV